MEAIARMRPLSRSVFALSVLLFLCGTGGMAISFVVLCSSDLIEVIAGASGFVAGAVMMGTGIVSIAILLRAPALIDGGTRGAAVPISTTPIQDVTRWRAHFYKNSQNRPEPAWDAPITLAATTVKPLLRSLEQFQLGDGGGPAYLVAWDREQFLYAEPGRRSLVDLWFAEEREHSRMLGRMVDRFGGNCIKGHWSFTTFCLTRQWLGVRFELIVLLLTEIASTVYYRLLRRHCGDQALRGVCRLILRDESGHIAYHRDRMAMSAQANRASHGPLWELVFRTLGLAAASMLWVNHARGLKAIGGTRKEFYGEVWAELTRFIRRLRFEECPKSSSKSGLEVG